MHGLMNRAIECFVRDAYGDDRWADVARIAQLGFDGFEAMLRYETSLTWRVLDAITDVLGKPRNDVLEDIGTYLVSHPKTEALRRLLRFGGVDFVDFLHSLDDLPERARLAVDDLDLPRLELRDLSSNSFSLTVHADFAGFGHVMVGVLRAMADDYGALVMLDHSGDAGPIEVISIVLVETAYAEGRSFHLGAGAG
ncbi:heme NO-binding domain-containing protein [Lutimaribacter sp. EGI FJ00015]|uniref:Heme NO-binding domain-containing protein n=1 Tax=Lutimaribacter degradans TaxID=2945989 RepID=A0ACC5ZTM1_9RHOB|nr:heme NO-binding domain-containing protein [Lutimaribacter sp. EGI FJ00013]MCM2560759.1 heme NO-binding domain-containing protein [Lutimaribacter sp. EGI FJ00013]MCO0612295.1 heme NO-binding domain-containing protein [Lutimaribacter sp. EGI FJ00015]MCO0634584.1 heme NO-binding domain-containing protein [Lutimaribacter sp. EGI FJ00014]